MPRKRKYGNSPTTVMRVPSDRVEEILSYLNKPTQETNISSSPIDISTLKTYKLRGEDVVKLSDLYAVFDIQTNLIEGDRQNSKELN